MLLALCLGISSCATAGIQFTLSKDGTYYIASGYESGTELTKLNIPAEYKGLPVKGLSNQMDHRQVVEGTTAISLPEGLICLDANFWATAYYADEGNWETVTEDGVTYRALYLNSYLLSVEIVSGKKTDGFNSFTVKDGTKGIASLAFADDSSVAYRLTIPSSVDFLGSSVAVNKTEVEKRCNLFGSSSNHKRITFGGTAEEWKELTVDLEDQVGEMTFYEDPAYDARDILATGYGIWIVNCTDGTCVYD